MRSSVPRGGRVARLRQQLAQRDLLVLRCLSHMRLLSLRQLQRLYMVDGAPGARTRRAQYLLKQLSDLGLVVRLSRVIGGIRAGSAGYIYGLSALGQKVLDVGGPLGGRRRRVWETKPYFQDHLLATSELYVRLVEFHRSHQADLLEFTPEPGAWRRFAGSGGELVILKPDAYVRLGVQRFELSAFIEVDLSTESLPTIRRKCLRFIAYWQSGMEQQRRGVFPKVMWLVQDEHRRERIVSVVQQLAIDVQVLFDVALLTAAPQALSQLNNQGAAA